MLKLGGVREKTVSFWYPFSANHYRYFGEIYKAPVQPRSHCIVSYLASSDHNLGPIYDGDNVLPYVIIRLPTKDEGQKWLLHYQHQKTSPLFQGNPI